MFISVKMLLVRDWGGETTQRRAAILGSVKKVGNHLRNVLAVYASMFRRRVIVSHAPRSTEL